MRFGMSFRITKTCGRKECIRSFAGKMCMRKTGRKKTGKKKKALYIEKRVIMRVERVLSCKLASGPPLPSEALGGHCGSRPPGEATAG